MQMNAHQKPKARVHGNNSETPNKAQVKEEARPVDKSLDIFIKSFLHDVYIKRLFCLVGMGHKTLYLESEKIGSC